MPPVRAVGGEDDVGASIEELLRRVELGAAREGEVVGAEDFFGGFRRGNDDGGDLSEGKMEDGSIFSGEALEREVGHAAELVEVADEGERRRTGRKINILASFLWHLTRN